MVPLRTVAKLEELIAEQVEQSSILEECRPHLGRLGLQPGAFTPSILLGGYRGWATG